MSDDGSSRFHRYALTSGELGSAGGQTLIAALLPVLLVPHAPSTFWIGAVIASEGLFALVLPYAAGAASDARAGRFGRLFGRRGRLLALAAPPMTAGLILIAALDGFWPLAGAAVLYFMALHMYTGPLRALLIDATPERKWGSIQGVMGATHVGGVAFGLVVGGLLFAVWEPLPFLVAAALVLGLTTVTLLAARQLGHGGGDRDDGANGDDGGDGESPAPRRELRFWRELATRRQTRGFLLGNVLWNGGVEGIRPYIFLFATATIGIAVETASLAMMGFMAAAGVGSVIVGRLGDRWGRERLLIAGAVLTGAAMIPGVFVRDLPALMVLLVPAGLGAAALIALPYPVFEGMVGDEDVGRSTGAFYASVGVSRILAPLAVGAAIDVGRGWFPDADGYPVMWPLCGALVLAGALVLWLTDRRSAAERGGDAT